MAAPSPKRFLLQLAAVLVCGLALTMGWLWLVDPFDIYHHHRWQGFNHHTPMSKGNRERLVKPRQINRDQPDVLILGTSRADAAIDPGHPFLQSLGNRTMNAALGGCTIWEAEQLAHHAHALGELRAIVLGLDVEMFCLTRGREKGWEKRLATTLHGNANLSYHFSDLMATLLSRDAWQAMRRTLRESKRQKKWTRTELEQRGGRYLEQKIKPENRWPQFEARLREAQHNFRSLRENQELLNQGLTVYARLLNWAQQQNIDLYIYISPYHVSLLDTMQRNQSWPVFEHWKQKLQQLNAGRFPLWDFSGRHTYALDPPPTRTDRARPMKWWLECSHFRKELGDLMLQRLAAGCGTPGFGHCL